MMTDQVAEAVSAVTEGVVRGEDQGPEQVPDNPLERYCAPVDRDGVKAWVRIPNPYLHQKVQDKGLAARTRKVRELKDSESDAFLRVEYHINSLEDYTDEQLYDALVTQHLAECTAQAQVIIESADLEKFPSHAEFRNIDDHRRNLHYEQRKPEPDTDTLNALTEIFTAYSTALQETTNQLLDEYRAKYGTMDRDGLIDCMRRAACKREADKAFIAAYNQWNMFYGTRNPDNHNLPYWATFDEMMDEDRHVIEVLVEEHENLEIKAGEAKKSPALTPISDTSEQSEN